MMSLWDALRMNMMISYQELVRTFLNKSILIVITHLYYVNAIYYFNNTIEVAMLLLGLNSFITNVIGLVIKKRAILLA